MLGSRGSDIRLKRVTAITNWRVHAFFLLDFLKIQSFFLLARAAGNFFPSHIRLNKNACLLASRHRVMSYSLKKMLA